MIDQGDVLHRVAIEKGFRQCVQSVTHNNETFQVTMVIIGMQNEMFIFRSFGP